MKAKHAGRANPYNSKKRRNKKSSFRKQFLGTDVRTVTQLIELKASPKRKLQIARQILAYTEKVFLGEQWPPAQLPVIRAIINDWRQAVANMKAAVKAENVKRSKVHTPFANLLR